MFVNGLLTVVDDGCCSCSCSSYCTTNQYLITMKQNKKIVYWFFFWSNRRRIFIICSVFTSNETITATTTTKKNNNHNALKGERKRWKEIVQFMFNKKRNEMKIFYILDRKKYGWMYTEFGRKKTTTNNKIQNTKHEI